MLAAMENDLSSPNPQIKKSYPMEIIDNVVEMTNHLSHVEIDLHKIDTNLKQVFFNSNNYLKTVIAIYILWIIVGMIFYKFYGDWTWATAFYYVAEAGLSIGFCSPADKDDRSRVFTIFLVLIGSTILVTLNKAIVYFMLLDQRITRKRVKYPHVRDPVTKQINYEKLLKYCRRGVLEFIGYYSSLSKFYIICVFVITIGLGTVYGMVVEKWSFITSLYWSVTSSSTGGLQSAVCLDGTDGKRTYYSLTHSLTHSLTYFSFDQATHVISATLEVF